MSLLHHSDRGTGFIFFDPTGCGAPLIREANSSDTDLLRESLAFAPQPSQNLPRRA